MPEKQENQLEKNRRLILGVKNNPSVAERIAPIFSETEIDKGVTLVSLTSQSFDNQRKEQIESESKTIELEVALNEVDAYLKRLRKMGRYFYDASSTESKAYNFRGDIPTDYATWKQCVLQCFNGVRNDEAVLTRLSAFGATVEEIDTYIAKLSHVDTLQIDSNRESAEAQMATVKKRELLAELNQYSVKLRACLDIFYEGNEKQELEKMGIVVK